MNYEVLDINLQLIYTCMYASLSAYKGRSDFTIFIISLGVNYAAIFDSVSLILNKLVHRD